LCRIPCAALSFRSEVIDSIGDAAAGSHSGSRN
jgi:hypothetical protein